LLHDAGTPDDAVDEVWKLFTEEYFLRYRSKEIAWHTQILADSDTESDYGLVDVRKQADGDGLEAVFYTPRSKGTFAHATAILDELGTTIVDARIAPIANEFSLDTYIFMELDPRTEIDDARLSKIRRTLTRILSTDDKRAMFPTKTVINFDNDISNKRTIMELAAGDRPGLLSTVGQTFIEFGMELAAGDRPGLLSTVGQTFIEFGINIETAKILTIGERAEDVFYIVDENNRRLTDEVCDSLRERLVERLDADT
jgi:[protein-PII] uridylyltransferase